MEWRQGGLAAWWEASKPAPEIVLRNRALMLYSLLEALDKPIGTAAWAALLGEGGKVGAVIPDAALRHTLRDAAEGGRVGETVLLALLVLGRDGAEAADPLTVIAVIGALRRIGFGAEARALALEAAIAAGV